MIFINVIALLDPSITLRTAGSVTMTFLPDIELYVKARGQKVSFESDKKRSWEMQLLEMVASRNFDGLSLRNYHQIWFWTKQSVKHRRILVWVTRSHEIYLIMPCNLLLDSNKFSSIFCCTPDVWSERILYILYLMSIITNSWFTCQQGIS